VLLSGPSNTGKSFLANQLLEAHGETLEQGFQLRNLMPGSNGARGISMWSRPLRVNEDTDALVLDCQGLNEEGSNYELDVKLFTLSLLLSSQLIFNTSGLISDNSLEDLSILQLLTNEMRLNAKETTEESSTEDEDEDEDNVIDAQNF